MSENSADPRQEKKRPTLLFLRRFLKHGRRVASIAPSSRAMARAACEHVDPRSPQIIVELGAGTGAITEVACRRMHPRSRLIAVEIDPIFAQVLASRCPRAEVLNCDVRDLESHLERLGIDKIDLLLNGLPTPSLPREVNQIVLECFAKYANGAYFSQLTVMPWIYKPMYRRIFEQVTFSLVPANLPPGGVYHCRGLRSDFLGRIPGKNGKPGPNGRHCENGNGHA